METTKLKLKVGMHEFEAEGTPEFVQEQLKAFRELIAQTPTTKAPSPSGSPSPSSMLVQESTESGLTTTAMDITGIEEQLTKIMKIDGRIVSLTVRAETLTDAALLVIYGQKMLRKNDTVSGSEIMAGLTATGLRVPRVDRLLEQMGDAGNVIVLGVHRAKRYRLTNIGLDKARRLAGKLIDTVA